MNFAPKVNFTTGEHPEPISNVDIDRDGKPDLIIAHSSSNTFSVLRNIIGIVPVAPSNLTLNVVSSSQITLTWKDNSDNEESFKIERKTGTSGSYAEIKTVSANTTTFPDNGLDDGTQYYYRVRAYNGAGNSGYCPEANDTTILPAPSNCVATAVAVDSVRVTWNDNSKNESGFRIERKISTGSYSTINTTNANATSYIDHSVSDNTLYYYRVFAINAITVSDASNEDTTLTPQLDRTPPPPPISAQISPSGWTNQSTFTITWTNPSDPSGIAKVWYSIDVVPSNQSPGTSVDITSSSVQVTIGTSGTHQIYFYLADGLGNKNPANIATVTAKFDNIAPDAPGSPAISPAVWSNQSNFTITWTNPSDISGIIKVWYSIDSAPTTGSPGTSVDVTNPSLQLTVTEEGTHVIYFFLEDAAGNKNPSNTVTITARYDATAPSSPSSVQKTPSGWTSKNQFDLAWSNPHDSSGIVKAWYRFDLEPSISNPGTGVDVSGSNPQIQISLPAGFTSGSHEFYLYLEDAAQNKNPNYYYQTEILYDKNAPTITDNTSLPSEVTVDNSTASPSVYISALASDGVGESGVRSLQLQYIRVGDAQTYLVNYDPPFNVTSSKVIPTNAFIFDNRANGVSYRLVASDSTSNVSATLWSSIVVKNAPSIVITNTTTLPAASNYPSNELGKAYRMFSVPYDLEDKRPSSFIPSSLGDHKKDDVQYANWRFQRVVGGVKQDYEEFANDVNAVAPGKGFFLIVKDPQKKITIGSNKVVRADLMNDTGIQLENGWNLVGTPLNMDIAFDSLVFVGGTYSNRAYFDGNGQHSGWWLPSDAGAAAYVNTLKAWEGLAIRVNSMTMLKFRSFGPQLRIGQKDGIYGKAIMAEGPSLSTNPMNWTVIVDASRSDINMCAKGNAFGMVQDAKKDQDQYDSFMPPFIGDKNVALYFRNPEGAMMRDIRSLNDTGDVWEMRVITGDASAKVKLQFGDMLNLPNPSFEAYLIDIDQKMAHDLKVTSTLEINSGNGVRNFHVVVGLKSFVEANNAGIELHPTMMRLYANYPNPFNPETIIRYTVPNSAERYHVILKIFNILGQEVVTLVNEEQKSGYYEVKYLAQNQSSGIYFYQITVTGNNQTFRDSKKAILIK